MLNPVELNLQPSCFEGLSWSPDGELAVAAGEHVHILIPKSGEIGPNTPGKEAWDIFRIRVNTFTNAEWAPIYPQNRDDFSLGAEQSESTVIGLSWSPPGLARFRRSALAVLTSNLILSLWEPIGPRALWTRVAVVNHVLHPNPSAPGMLTGEELRKANIRSFHWCSPLKPPARPKGSHQVSDAESRWGILLMSVANDANELIILRIHRIANSPSPTRSYDIKTLTSHQLRVENNTPNVCPGSLLQKALQLKSRILSVSTGPWSPVKSCKENGVYSTTAMLAAVYGKKLYPLKTTITIQRSTSSGDPDTQYQVLVDVADHALKDSASRWENDQVEGPIRWIYTNQSPKINLVAGTATGFLTISMSRSLYEGSTKETDHFDCWSTSTSSFSIEDGEPRNDWDYIAAMTTSTDDKNDSCLLHIGTAAAMGAVVGFEKSSSEEPDPNNTNLSLPRWSNSIKIIREQFDLDNDLRGYAMTRIWGLASYHGVIAFLINHYPTNMIQYKVASQERAIVGFAFENSDATPDPTSPFSSNIDPNTHQGGVRKGESLDFLLSQCENGDEINDEDQRLVYAAACCSIVDERFSSNRPQAQKALEFLSSKTGADLSEEISKCTEGTSTISTKSSDQLAQPGGHLFEKCEICNAGIPWTSVTEAQCESGHLFARCGLTSHAIQEPGISKYCSACHAEYLDEELVARLRDEPPSPVFVRLTRAFDTCLSCDSKFRCSNIAQ